MCNKPFAIAPALHPSVISAKESVSCEVPVTCSKPPTSEEWTLVTSKRHPRLAIKSNSKLHVVCTIQQSCPSSGSLKSQVCFSKKPVGFAEQPTKLKNWNCGRKAVTKRRSKLAIGSHSKQQVSFTRQPAFILPVMPLSQGLARRLLGSQKQPPFILPGSSNTLLSSPSISPFTVYC
ncbi:hypothetical protein JTE90_018342 [Oedothorax gibbosus]|uniref:Uncharacterized protein n=1 Tax=Oedothorax gibbosus TaxID=931172 RepID=A0AAV6U0Z9_9ARAC|nr:hypothetical protein JTE90_018342 [Oedothorax gibbosus]